MKRVLAYFVGGSAHGTMRELTDSYQRMLLPWRDGIGFYEPIHEDAYRCVFRREPHAEHDPVFVVYVLEDNDRMLETINARTADLSRLRCYKDGGG